MIMKPSTDAAISGIDNDSAATGALVLERSLVGVLEGGSVVTSRAIIVMRTLMKLVFLFEVFSNRSLSLNEPLYSTKEIL